MSCDGPNVVVVDHKLGLSMNILKPMFAYAVPELYHLCVHFELSDDKETVENIRKMSLACLLVKGDFPPALDIRKSLVEKGCLNAQEEIRLTGVIFSKHPKSPSCWYHRKWCLQFLVKTSQIEFSSIVSSECDLCSRMCDLYPKNYYSWNHRLWIIKFMDKIQVHKMCV